MDIQTFFDAYREASSPEAQEKNALRLLSMMMSQDLDISSELVMHVADLWLDYFSVEIRTETRDGGEDWASSRSSEERPSSMIREIVTAREWLLTEDGSSAVDKASGHTLLIHHVYVPVEESSPNSTLVVTWIFITVRRVLKAMEVGPKSVL